MNEAQKAALKQANLDLFKIKEDLFAAFGHGEVYAGAEYAIRQAQARICSLHYDRVIDIEVVDLVDIIDMTA